MIAVLSYIITAALIKGFKVVQHRFMPLKIALVWQNHISSSDSRFTSAGSKFGMGEVEKGDGDLQKAVIYPTTPCCAVLEFSSRYHVCVLWWPAWPTFSLAVRAWEIFSSTRWMKVHKDLVGAFPRQRCTSQPGPLLGQGCPLCTCCFFCCGMILRLGFALWNAAVGKGNLSNRNAENGSDGDTGRTGSPISCVKTFSC